MPSSYLWGHAFKMPFICLLLLWQWFYDLLKRSWVQIPACGWLFSSLSMLCNGSFLKEEMHNNAARGKTCLICTELAFYFALQHKRNGDKPILLFKFQNSWWDCWADERVVSNPELAVASRWWNRFVDIAETVEWRLRLPRQIRLLFLTVCLLRNVE